MCIGGRWPAAFNCSMMRTTIVSLFLSFSFPALSQTLEDIWAFKYAARPGGNIKWYLDDDFYTDLTPKGDLVKIAVGVQTQETLVTADKLRYDGKNLSITDYEFSQDGKRLLIFTTPQKLYRHSATFVAYVYDFSAQQLYVLNEGRPVFLPTLLPDGQNAAFVHENNLYLQEIKTGKTTALTQDGKKNHVINGHTDWVYEEEFGFTQAYFPSASGRYLAYYRFDESGVPEFSMPLYKGLYPENYTFKYPKAGDPNAAVSIHFYDLKEKRTIKADLGAETDVYFPRIKWAGERLLVMKMNRLQNRNEIFRVDPATGKARLLFTETDEAYIEQPADDTWIFLPDDTFLWQSERDGYNHVYRYDLEGRLLNRVTGGEWDVTEIYGQDGRTLYFQSYSARSTEREIYRVDLKGGERKPVMESAAPGWHGATFSPRCRYFIHTFSDVSTPTITTLRTADGRLVRVINDNAAVKQELEKLKLAPKEFFTLKAADGQTELNAWMLKPKDFDPGKKYPVWMNLYGGPGSQQVVNRYDGSNGMWYQMLAQKGIVSVCVDNRGTGGKGARFKKCTYKQLGKLETEDQIAAARYLAGLPFVDPQRIGIWGWSFGGYMSTLCITKGADVFAAAIAVAPVTNWRYYDTIYTERFLQTPQLNPQGYDDNSPIHFADKLKGKYLIVHGTADDNVHAQNAYEMIDALVAADKSFQMFLYPDRDHGIYGGNTRLHLYRLMTEFIEKNL
jgi:dipeptidyl-peptidase-4